MDSLFPYSDKFFISVRPACPPKLAEPEGPDKRRLGVNFE
jgi:hypothetical protein